MAEASKPTRRLTRCRTGCIRCRIRRRKCDEGKPRCRNCTDRNFQCQYGPQLTFLTKNAHTVQAPEVGGVSAVYETIRFVKEEPQKDDSEDLERTKERPLSPVEIEELQQSHHELGGENKAPPNAVPQSRSQSQSQVPSTMFSDNDESAVAGLLALGTTTNEIMAPNLSLPVSAVSPPKGPLVTMSQEMTPSKYIGFTPTFLPSQLADTTPSTLAITPTQTLELLRHYRYEVAPWLDICDLGQLFGIQGLQLAMVSQPVWFSVLALSETSMNLLRPFAPIMITDQTPGAPASPEAQLDITKLAFIRAIDDSKNCIRSIRAAWSPQRMCDQELLEALNPHSITGRNLSSAIYWLFVRLDLAAALATDTDIQVLLPRSFPHGVNEHLGTDPFEEVFCFAHRPLWLCARAVQFMHNDDPSPHHPPLHAWLELVEQLEQWYQERPQGFQPMMEIDMEDHPSGMGQGFPIVLFANGAGVFSNQLYHTAMLVLLHIRPRTARLTDFHSTTMSPLWHSQRICSIALNNERRECWDPVLLASFLVAARRMTHESQQQEILLGFERIHGVTGWDATDFLHDLQQEWGFIET